MVIGPGRRRRSLSKEGFLHLPPDNRLWSPDPDSGRGFLWSHDLETQPPYLSRETISLSGLRPPETPRGRGSVASG
ncbi:hypothetical protein BH24CHL2_BH24CHL2_7110 [soil metagenome]